ncbi:helix-turn-helix transcriptional regulator [Novosphingobium huizhouense]|uniref:helix-turn-helix transcriptional regulator n=1 Tax=Novosphingobium huizhouense TaxID=2866625 RepID=UPI001CD85E10|nr:AraC family transcriptional regulator [Novosphingobium huizhouense]
MQDIEPLRLMPAADATGALVGAARAAALQGLVRLDGAIARPVRSGLLRSFGQWLDWPDWLYRGTGLAGHQGAVPATITLADDVLILANIIDAGCLPAVIARLVEMPWPVISNAGMTLMLAAPDLATTLSVMAEAASAGVPHVGYRFARKEHGGAAFCADHAVALGPVSAATGLVATIFAAKMTRIYVGAQIGEARLCARALLGVDGAKLGAALGCAIVAEANEDCFEFPAAWAQTPNSQHEPAEWDAMLAAHLEHVRRAGETDVVARIRRIVCDHLAHERRAPRLKEVAGREGVSNRTMVRMLAGAGTSFHAIVDDERKRMTAQLIRRDELSLADVAAAIGFTDMSTFGRSFRAWFGVPPGRYRRALGEAAQAA